MSARPRDHDFLEDREGWIFCVVGDVHPPDGFFAYPKYVPGEGPWRRGGRSFERILKNYTMPELRRILEDLKRSRPSYVRHDWTIGAEMFFVHSSMICRHYSCREGLARLLEERELDPLQQLAKDLVLLLHDHGGVELDCMGITGSILLGIHHQWSDVDIVVYGKKNFWRALEAVEKLGLHDHREMLERFRNHYPIDGDDAEKLAKRVRHKGYYRGVKFSIHGVRSDDELDIKYGDIVYRPIGVGTARLEVLDSGDSGLTPSVYRVSGFAETAGKKYPVEWLTCYDLSFTALFRPGDTLEALGKIEEAEDRRSGRRFYNLLIGSMEAAGREYLKLSD